LEIYGVFFGLIFLYNMKYGTYLNIGYIRSNEFLYA
jgi:hypothetical protein